LGAVFFFLFGGGYQSFQFLPNVKNSFLNTPKACLGKSEIHFRKNPVESLDNSSCQVKPHRQKKYPGYGFCKCRFLSGQRLTIRKYKRNRLYGKRFKEKICSLGDKHNSVQNLKMLIRKMVTVDKSIKRFFCFNIFYAETDFSDNPGLRAISRADALKV
jgi:hypothetical protein